MVTVGSNPEEIRITRELLEKKDPFSFKGEKLTEQDGVFTNGKGLEMRFAVERYEGSAAVEWTLWFENKGECNCAQISDVLPLDIELEDAREVLVSYAKGTSAVIDDFAFCEDRLTERLRYESVGSKQVTPFFNIDLGGYGFFLAVGWTKNWFLELWRENGKLRLCAGMPHTDFYLKPGEHVRTPRILLMGWKREKEASYNLLRRHLVAHHIPKDQNGEPYPPICLNSWGAMKTENHLRLLDLVKREGLQYDVYWIDAGWYGEDHETEEYQRLGDDDWFFHQGNWRVNRALHPQTLKPVSDAAHQLGMKLLLWYDVYNCIEGIGWAKEHPEWGHWVGPMGKNNTHDGVMVSIMNINNEEARRWLIRTLISSMKENGVDCYREDPPPIYGGEDEEGRVGVGEMKAVEALYEIWDSLLESFPGMIIDNCGGGATRVDLETVSRSYVLWRSDYNCHPQADPIGSQVGNIGLGHFVPLVCCAPPTKPGDDYTFRSGLYGGMGFGLFHVCAFENGLTYPLPDYPIQWHREKLNEYRAVKPYLCGDFHVLADCGVNADGWCCYEMFRPDLEEGVLLGFRRPLCPESSVSVKPVLGEGSYLLTDRDTGEERICQNGQSLHLTADEPSRCVMLLIKKMH